jgi:hypothetical protein
MDDPEGKEQSKKESTCKVQPLENQSITDVPIETRLQEAKKPLFLTRYE